jgi:predicted DNA binding CopG/RHH family protein
MRNLLDNNVCLSYIHDMKRISMFLSEPQLLALKKLSKRVGIKVSELIRRFIDEGLKRS